MPEPTPIPGRWDDQIVNVAASLAFDQEDAAYHLRRLSEGAAPDSEVWVSRTVLENAGVVPVPDGQAIERAARALASRRRPLGYGLDTVLAARIAREAREDVLVVLAAALEQPE
jgi:hypothetical protein